MNKFKQWLNKSDMPKQLENEALRFVTLTVITVAIIFIASAFYLL